MFRNPIGIAGGFDKDAQLLDVFADLSLGFAEVGTVTPRAQLANAGKILDRDWNAGNVWNRMGFPNRGMQEMKARLMTQRGGQQIPLFVNIGKNRDTDLIDAHLDYQRLAKELAHLADALVINISSPNTTGLRDLQQSFYLQKLVISTVEQAGSCPVLIKLSPDLEPVQLKKTLQVSMDAGCSGFVLTNTTLARPGDGKVFSTEGGVSGRYLKEKSLWALNETISYLGPNKKNQLIISVGGIESHEDVVQRIRLGADLVQVYSAWIFQGPFMIKRWLSALQRGMLKDYERKS